MTLLRPSPITDHSVKTVSARINPKRVFERLRDGEELLVTDSYQTGAEILDTIEHLLPKPSQNASYDEIKRYKRRKRTISLRLRVPIKDHTLNLEGERYIGFLKVLYPNLHSFQLPLLNVQELHRAWYLYQEGIHMPVLGHRIHPFWNTYAPTRTEHLELFATWLSQYKEKKESAVDVGTGSGILALMLRKHGFQQITATDNNPNAIESLKRECIHNPHDTTINLLCTDLLSGVPQSELIVFNPPWIPGSVFDAFDSALYFDDDLFERFFDQAHQCLSPSGSIVILFSNIMTLLRPDIPHPIEAEGLRGRFTCTKKMKRKIKPKDSRRRTKEKAEIWELSRI